MKNLKSNEKQLKILNGLHSKRIYIRKIKNIISNKNSGGTFYTISPKNQIF